MPHAKVTFVRAIVNSQELGSTDEHIISNIFSTSKLMAESREEA
jgi:hypothetical protein